LTQEQYRISTAVETVLRPGFETSGGRGCVMLRTASRRHRTSEPRRSPCLHPVEAATAAGAQAPPRLGRIAGPQTRGRVERLGPPAAFTIRSGADRGGGKKIKQGFDCKCMQGGKKNLIVDPSP
jgi:hypothetical protein